jgi:hypothetical protein
MLIFGVRPAMSHGTCSSVMHCPYCTSCRILLIFECCTAFMGLGTARQTSLSNCKHISQTQVAFVLSMRYNSLRTLIGSLTCSNTSRMCIKKLISLLVLLDLGGRSVDIAMYQSCNLAISIHRVRCAWAACS